MKHKEYDIIAKTWELVGWAILVVIALAIFEFAGITLDQIISEAMNFIK